MPSLNGVLETSLYVDDLDRASSFYEDLFGLSRIIEGDARLRAYSVGGRSVLLLFKRGASNCVTQLPLGKMGPHDGSGPLHLAFSISIEDLSRWEKVLAERGIAVESRVQWPRGGTSLYFRDPDNHLVELATPGVWSIY
jgi:catechol 2,3-dioxygenase-like lactoylglutathione lyase family enzyme